MTIVSRGKGKKKSDLEGAAVVIVTDRSVQSSGNYLRRMTPHHLNAERKKKSRGADSAPRPVRSAHVVDEKGRLVELRGSKKESGSRCVSVASLISVERAPWFSKTETTRNEDAHTHELGGKEPERVKKALLNKKGKEPIGDCLIRNGKLPGMRDGNFCQEMKSGQT